MSSKKKKYNARFPAGRIKKIMQTDEEIGKVAQAVPVIISRTLELFVESLLKRAMQITSAKNAKTLTPTHLKQCILSESRFDFLKDLVKGIPDVSNTDDELCSLSGNNSPGTPLSGKAYSGYTCFQFRQSSDSSSSKSSGAASHFCIPETSQPKFYKEIPIGSEDCENKHLEKSTSSGLIDTTITHHTAPLLSNHCVNPSTNRKNSNSSLLKTISGRNITQLNDLRLSNCTKEEEEEEEEDEENEYEPEENGYHRRESIGKTCTLDEDYDT